MLEARAVVNQCYILQERLGEDSFCELWRATSIYAATQFLLRFLKETQGLEGKSGDFRRLAMDCYSIAGAAIQDFVEVERFGERTFIASEFGNQRNLRYYFEAMPRVKLEHACRFLIELGQGLDAFHKRGIIYTCLNAENILVASPSGYVESIRVQKPGYAVFLPLVDEGDKSAVFNNYGYLSPEAKAGLPLDRRSDLYSLGVLFFRFVVGKMPYGTVARARSGSVSPSYVAKAFARRDVPDVVTRIVLKALRKRPAQRQADAIELIAELRGFMDARRRELLASGEVDPLAELETLNLGKDRIEASQAVRSLDTADYFRAISEAFVAPQHEESARLFPVDDFLKPDEVERLEAEEAEGEEDDGRASVDSWIRSARESVGRETVSERRGIEKAKATVEPQPPLQVEESRPEPEGEAGAGMPRAEEDELAASIVRNPLDFALELTELPASAEEGEAIVYASDPASARSLKKQKTANVDSGGVSWRPASARPQEVAEGMESAFSRAFKGIGAFRFIQEPPPGPEVVAFARVFARFRAKGLVVDLGVLPAGADSTDLLRALRGALALGLGYESPQARAALAKRLRGLDEIGAFAGPPLGALLFGSDGVEPDPAWIETTEGAMRLALTLASLGRRRRPLVLTLRGAEAIGPSAHDVLVELARLAPIASFCCFAFYKPAPVPEWHVLSKLAAGQ